VAVPTDFALTTVLLWERDVSTTGTSAVTLTTSCADPIES